MRANEWQRALRKARPPSQPRAGRTPRTPASRQRAPCPLRVPPPLRGRRRSPPPAARSPEGRNAPPAGGARPHRQHVLTGKSVSLRVYLVRRLLIKKTNI